MQEVSKSTNPKSLANHRSQPAFEFFNLPRELRDLVYQHFWWNRYRIAAYYPQCKIGMMAYYNGTKYRDCEKFNRYAIQLYLGTSHGPHFSPCHDIPVCLKASKQPLNEAMAHFHRYAHWNIWPISTYEKPYLSKRFEAIMSPQHVRSLSIETCFRLELLSHSSPRYFEVKFQLGDRKWLDLFVKQFQPASALRFLNMKFTSPYPNLTSKPPHASEIGISPLLDVITPFRHVKKFEIVVDGNTVSAEAESLSDLELAQELRNIVATKVKERSGL
jgi:hypothetical protein